MTTLELSSAEEEIKAWMHADLLRTLDEMGYSSYQEYLNDMSYNEMVNPLCD